jgi:hypothetical protein
MTFLHIQYRAHYYLHAANTMSINYDTALHSLLPFGISCFSSPPDLLLFNKRVSSVLTLREILFVLLFFFGKKLNTLNIQSVSQSINIKASSVHIHTDVTQPYFTYRCCMFRLSLHYHKGITHLKGPIYSKLKCAV